MTSPDLPINHIATALETIRTYFADRWKPPEHGNGVLGSSFFDDVARSVAVVRLYLEDARRIRAWSDLADEAGGVGAYDYDVSANTLRWSNSVRALYGIEDISSPSLEQWLAAVHPDDRARVLATAQSAIRDGEDVHQTYRIQLPTGRVIWIEDRGKVLVNADGKPGRVVGLNIDVTELKEAQQQRELLMGELNHRVKNIITMIQAIVRSTLQKDRIDLALRKTLDDRLVAIAGAHDILIHTNWEGGNIVDIVRVALAPHIDPADRIQVNGPAHPLGPQKTLALSLVLHELSTNALKYGSLSRPEGRVELSWSVETQANRAVIRMSWIEHDGPAVQPPSHEGFGSRLIRQAFRSDPEADVRLSFAPDGLVCSIVFADQR